MKAVVTRPRRPILILRVEPTISRAAGPEPSSRLHPLIRSYPVLPTGTATLAPGVGRCDASGVGPAHPPALPSTGRADEVRTAGVSVRVPPAGLAEDGGPVAVLACRLARAELGLQ